MVDDEEFSDKISHMFELFTNIKLEDITNQIIKYYTDNGDIVLAKNYKLAYDKFFKAIEELINLLTNYRLNINSFVDILKVYLENISITIPPIIDDTVMVYDINNSFIDKNDYMYILSCVEGMVPKVISDVSLISDKEINFFDEDLRLNPTCELVNKRSKFKLYEHMFKYNNNLYISYHKSSSGGKVLPSSLITSLTKVLPQVSLIDGDKYITDYGTFTDRSTKSKFLLNNICNNAAITNLINMTKNYKTNEVNDYFKKYYFSLMKALPNQNVVSTILSNYSFDNTVSGLATNNLYFAKGTSVSEIETYYNCPYKHFIRYGLRVAENKTGTLMANDIGNILHEFGSVIITKQSVKSKDVKDIAHSVLKNILEEKYSVYLANNSNKYIIKNLYDESVRIAKAIFDQQSNSKFKNKYNEKYFSKILELSHTHNGTTVYVKGFIDRIDVCEDKFALIDYKTGADKFSYRDLVSGKKLQLFVYVKAVEKMTDMIPVCTCYLPIRNDFSKSKEDNSYKLNGVFSNSVSDLSNLDKNYLDKKLSNINLTFKKDGTLDKRSSTYAISSENISKLADFALDMVNMAISNIIDGDISIYPLYDTDSACNRCSYKGICNFSTLYKNKYRFVDKVANCDEILDKGENE